MKKKISFGLAFLMLGISVSQTSCIGSFALTKKVLDWNRGLGNKFLQEVVFIVFAAVLPVYGITTLIDAVILNLIEFWSGSNPMAMKEGEKDTKMVRGNDGDMYEVTAMKNKFMIHNLNNNTKNVDFSFNPANLTWSMFAQGAVTKVCTLHTDAKGEIASAEVFRADGTSFTVDKSNATKSFLTNALQSATPAFALAK